MRGGMGLLGVIGKYGMYRLNNSLALLDVHIRGVTPRRRRAGRNWSNYTWHGDQAPGQPWVHGLQNSDCDFNDLRFSKLIIMDGKNLVENKMADSHWFIECMERGAKIVVIAPEYGPPSTKADYWIPIRPQTDAALWLGVTRLMIENAVVRRGVRQGIHRLPAAGPHRHPQRLRAARGLPQLPAALAADGPSMTHPGPHATSSTRSSATTSCGTSGPGRSSAITRDDVGDADGAEAASTRRSRARAR